MKKLFLSNKNSSLRGVLATKQSTKRNYDSFSGLLRFTRNDNDSCLVITAIIFAFSLMTFSGSAFSKETEKQFWEEIPFLAEGNKKITLGQFKGKVIFLTFWRINCPYCNMQMPAMNLVGKHYGKNPNLAIIAVSSDESDKIIKNFFISNNYENIPIYRDETGELFEAFGLRGVPSDVIIDKKGNVVSVKSGAGSYEIDLIEKLMKE